MASIELSGIAGPEMCPTKSKGSKHIEEARWNGYKSHTEGGFASNGHSTCISSRLSKGRREKSWKDGTSATCMNQERGCKMRSV